MNACVCAFDASCCDTAWKPTCVDTAVILCGLGCDCGVLATPCTDDTDCAGCDDGDLCNGSWACQAGQCAAVAPVDCAPSAEDNGCLRNACDPLFGDCAVAPQDADCDDEDPCTVDTCDGADGTCSNAALASCAPGPPCKASPVAGTSDTATGTCVCALDTSCCAVAWDVACVDLAQAVCGLSCACDTLGAAALGCTTNTDCAQCDLDEDPCNGTWACQAGICAPVAEVQCDPSSDDGCVQSTCDPSTGQCALGPSAAACDDTDLCTFDFCDPDTASCVHDPMEGCTCAGRCGDLDFTMACQCDADCVQAGDCCPDLCTECAGACQGQ